jgi:hypothetical protein
MLQARSPGGQLHLLAAGFFVGAGSEGVPPVVAAVAVDFGLGPVRAVVVGVGGADAAPVAGAAAADEPVSDGIGIATTGRSSSVTVATGSGAGGSGSLISRTTTVAARERMPTPPMTMPTIRIVFFLAGGGSEAFSWCRLGSMIGVPSKGAESRMPPTGAATTG